MRLQQQIALNLAHAMLAVAWTPRDLDAAIAGVVPGLKKRTRAKLIAGLFALFDGRPAPTPVGLAEVLRGTAAVRGASAAARKGRRWVMSLATPRFMPMALFAELDIPQLETPVDLAHWLDVSLDDLDWLADARRQSARTAIPILQNYHYHFVPKRSGPPRLIEEPKPRLKAIQRRLLHEILSKVPTHEAAHGFVAGRSCLTSAGIHAGEALVVALDLKDFFPMTPTGRVSAMLRALGYPDAVARLITGLCTTATPRAVFRRLPLDKRHDHTTQQRYATPHLPQGAPTSPALANLAAFRLDKRLAGLARSHGASYTRYADDIAISGGRGLSTWLAQVLMLAERIAREEGYAINTAKTRVMPAKDRQRVTGLVINDHINVARADYDALKAILHNCRRHGAEMQNREGHRDFAAHLDGRVSWVEQVNPKRGAKLRAIYDEIAWRG